MSNYDKRFCLGMVQRIGETLKMADEHHEFIIENMDADAYQEYARKLENLKRSHQRLVRHVASV